ncbi:MAG: DJ-1/PfpI family protein [Candidatus Riflebacteria bacterium]|nr:DJ-1/PfpI family protein [Candidatus Riflebacteria bacterium]
MDAVHAIVLLADGFEEIEAVTPVDVLRRAGVTVTVAGLKAGPARGSRGVTMVPDATLDEVASGRFDLVVLPGGMPGARTLGEDARVRKLIRDARDREAWVAAICAAPAMVLAPLDLLAGIPATGHPSMKERVPDWRVQPVVTSGKVVTSQGPGTAMAFALTLVKHLLGDEKAAQIASPMIVRWEA